MLKQKNKTLIKVIEYYYYCNKLSNSKDGEKNNNKGIKLIKTFIKNMYYLYGKIKGKKDEQAFTYNTKEAANIVFAFGCCAPSLK